VSSKRGLISSTEKEAVREYLESSGLTHASLFLPGFLENMYRTVKKTSNGYNIAIPIMKTEDLRSLTWISRDLPAAVLALLNNYTDPTKKINGKTYPVVSAIISGTKLAELAEKSI
jgi:hypothetical protein